MEYHHYFIGQFRVFFSVFHQPVFKPYEGFHVVYDIGALVHFFDSGGQLYQIVGYLLSFQVLVRIFNGVIDNGEDLLRDLLACHAIACLELFPSLLVDPPGECLPRYCGKFEDAFYRDALQVECLRCFFGFMFRSCYTGRLKFETKMRIPGADRKK